MKTKNTALRRFFFSRLFLLIISLGVLFTAIGFGRAYYQAYQIRQQIRALQNDLNALQKKKLASLEILSYVLSQNFVEEKARTELNLKKPGEHVAVIPNQATTPVINAVSTGVSGQHLANPIKWWYYFSHKSI